MLLETLLDTNHLQCTPLMAAVVAVHLRLSMILNIHPHLAIKALLTIKVHLRTLMLEGIQTELHHLIIIHSSHHSMTACRLLTMPGVLLLLQWE
jgi:hypothetical protein